MPLRSTSRCAAVRYHTPQPHVAFIPSSFLIYSDSPCTPVPAVFSVRGPGHPFADHIAPLCACSLIPLSCTLQVPCIHLSVITDHSYNPRLSDLLDSSDPAASICTFRIYSSARITRNFVLTNTDCTVIEIELHSILQAPNRWVWVANRMIQRSHRRDRWGVGAGVGGRRSSLQLTAPVRDLIDVTNGSLTFEDLLSVLLGFALRYNNQNGANRSARLRPIPFAAWYP